MINIDKIEIYNNNCEQYFKPLRGYVICIESDENNPAGKEVDIELYSEFALYDEYFTDIMNTIIEKVYNYIVNIYGIKHFDLDITVDMFFFEDNNLQIALNIGEIYK